jgi:hypothetical protein
VSASVSGLNATSTYHYRIVARSPAGTAMGSDLTFTTATPPEFGRCKATSPEVQQGNRKVYHGRFTDNACTVLSDDGQGKYEWFTEVAHTHFTMSAGGKILLETTGGARTACVHGSGAGEYTGAKQ